jgi:hypothetical protein
VAQAVMQLQLVLKVCLQLVIVLIIFIAKQLLVLDQGAKQHLMSKSF